MTKLILGCGYLGHRVAKKWQAAGDDFFVMTRSEKRALALKNDGMRVIVADLMKSETLNQVPDVETILYSIGYDRRSEYSIDDLFHTAMTNTLAHLSKNVDSFIYISTTGVYGQSDGSWVDEDSVCDPKTKGALAHFSIEQILQQSPIASKTVVLRLAGIYGPDRLPRQADLLAERPIPTPSDGYLNLIHVDDVVQVVLAVESKPQPSPLYLVCDNNPTKRVEYLTELARLLGASKPNFDSTLVNDRPTRGLSNKRIRNLHMLNDLKIQLLYPSFREGLAALVMD